MHINWSIAKIKDYDTGTIKIQKKKPKSKNSVRTIPLKSKAIEVIEKIIKIQQKLGIKSDRIIATLNNTYVSSTLFIYRINNLLKRIQSEKEIVSHGLRHTFVTLSADAGVHLNVVSSWVGHKNVEITYHYNHILKTQVDKGVTLLENW